MDPKVLNSRALRTKMETGMVQGLWSGGLWGVAAGCGASFEASRPVGSSTKQKEAPQSGWEGTHMSQAGLGGPVARGVPVQSWYSGGLVGRGSAVPGQQGPRESGRECVAPGPTERDSPGADITHSSCHTSKCSLTGSLGRKEGRKRFLFLQRLDPLMEFPGEGERKRRPSPGGDHASMSPAAGSSGPSSQVHGCRYPPASCTPGVTEHGHQCGCDHVFIGNVQS